MKARQTTEPGPAPGPELAASLILHLLNAVIEQNNLAKQMTGKIDWDPQWKTGKLLLTVGLLDKNVDPSSTLQVVDALIKADKDFELIAFPSGGHGVGDSPYGNRRREEFFVRHLME